MEQVKEIKQLRRKEEVLENINDLQIARMKQYAGPPMLLLAGITGALGLFLFVSLFLKRS